MFTFTDDIKFVTRKARATEVKLMVHGSLLSFAINYLKKREVSWTLFMSNTHSIRLVLACWTRAVSTIFDNAFKNTLHEDTPRMTRARASMPPPCIFTGQLPTVSVRNPKSRGVRGWTQPPNPSATLLQPFPNLQPLLVPPTWLAGLDGVGKSSINRADIPLLIIKSRPRCPELGTPPYHATYTPHVRDCYHS